MFNIFFSKYPKAPHGPIMIGQEDVDPFAHAAPPTIVSKYSMPKNEQIIFEGKIHISVGIWIEVEYDKGFFSLECRGASPAGCMPGGDSFVRDYVFTPKKKGVTEIVFTHIFRNDVVKTEKFEIKIK